MRHRYAAVYTGSKGPVSALFEARDLDEALRTLQEQGDMWFVMMRDDLRLQRKTALDLPAQGFRPVPHTITPDYALYLRERASRQARPRGARTRHDESAQDLPAATT